MIYDYALDNNDINLSSERDYGSYSNINESIMMQFNNN